MKGRKPPRSAEPTHKVSVQIAGEEHTLRSVAPPEYTRAVARHVDDAIRALPPSLEPHRAAILAALSITDELFRLREEMRLLREDTERRLAEAADRLEDARRSADEPV
jgi:cell division protein ZapA